MTRRLPLSVHALSRRATATVALLFVAALIGMSGVAEAHGAPSWVARWVQALDRRPERRVTNATVFDTATVWGPKTFSLGTAPSATFVEAFTVSSPDSGGFVLVHVGQYSDGATIYDFIAGYLMGGSHDGSVLEQPANQVGARVLSDLRSKTRRP